MSDEGCCNTYCLKNTLNLFNILFLFGGCAILGVSLWTIFDKYDYVSLLTCATYPLLLNFLLAAGSLLILVSFMGCYGIIRENRRVILVYLFLIVLIFLIEVMVGIVGYIYESNIRSELKLNLNDTILTNYGIDDAKTYAIDELQEKFSCCGAEDYEDWKYSYWITDGLTIKNKVPDSCCKTIASQCGSSDHPSNIHDVGCIDQMEQHMKDHLLIFSAVGVGIGLLQIIGIILACKLYFSLKENYNSSETRKFLPS